MLHANGLLSHLSSERCSMMDLFLEMDRILRPEVWLVFLTFWCCGYVFGHVRKGYGIAALSKISSPFLGA